MKPKYWAIIILAAIAISVSVLYYFQTKRYDLGPIEIHRKSEVSLSANELKDWETYANSEYGFEFKYPKELATNKDYDVKVEDPLAALSLIQDGPGAFYQRIWISVWQSRIKNQGQYKIGENCKQGDFDGTSEPKVESCSVASLNPFAFKEILHDSQNNQIFTRITVLNSKYEIFINFPSEINETLINQILSTFKFIN